METLLENNKELIERFVALVTCNDYIIDSRHKWFYSEISERQLLLLNIEAEDIRQDIIVFILEQFKKKGSDRYLPLSLARFVRDKLIKLIKQSNVYSTNSSVWSYPIDIRWILNEDNLPLTAYERYLLYLDCCQCYTINEISKLTYQDRSTIRKSLKTSKQILIQELL